MRARGSAVQWRQLTHVKSEKDLRQQSSKAAWPEREARMSMGVGNTKEEQNRWHVQPPRVPAHAMTPQPDTALQTHGEFRLQTKSTKLAGTTTLMSLHRQLECA